MTRKRKEDDDLRCSFCRKEFTVKGNRKQHENYCTENPDSSKAPKFNCTYCKEPLKRKTTLRRHMTFTCPNRPSSLEGNNDSKIKAALNCQFCRKAFNRKENRHMHEKHCPQNPNAALNEKYHCDYCNRPFGRKEHRRRHMKEACPKRPQPYRETQPLQPSNPNEKQQHESSDPSSAISTGTESPIRKKKKNPEGQGNDNSRQKTIPPNPKTKWSCKFCGARFTQGWSCKRHENGCENNPDMQKLKCQLCDDTFKSKGTYSRHLRRCHPTATQKEIQSSSQTLFNNKKKCDGCRKVLTRHIFYKMHIKRCPMRRKPNGHSIPTDNASGESREHDDMQHQRHPNKSVNDKKAIEVQQEQDEVVELVEPRIDEFCHRENERADDYDKQKQDTNERTSSHNDEGEALMENNIASPPSRQHEMNQSITALYTPRKTIKQDGLQCRFCQKEFTWKSSRKDHENYYCSKNPEPLLRQKVHCSYCSRPFNKQSNLRRHMTSTCPNRPSSPEGNNDSKIKASLNCQFCRKAFNRKWNCVLHENHCPQNQNAALNEKYHCDYCNRPFGRKEHRRRHMKEACPKRPRPDRETQPLQPSNPNEKQQHESSDPSSAISTGTESPIRKKNNCDYCNRPFGRKYHLRRHMKEACPKRPQPDRETQPLHSSSPNEKQQHESSDPPSAIYTGTESPIGKKKKNQEGQGNDNSRQKTISPNPKTKWSCKFCGARFTHGSNCKRHEKVCENNPDKQTLKCQLCDDTFTRKDSYTIHLHRSHPTATAAATWSPGHQKKQQERKAKDNTRPQPILPNPKTEWSCKFCRARFLDGWKCKRHENGCVSNPDKQTLQCPICGDTFMRKDSYTKHLRRCHPTVTEKELQSCQTLFNNKKKCDGCRKVLTRHVYYKMHIKRCPMRRKPNGNSTPTDNASGKSKKHDDMQHQRHHNKSADDKKAIEGQEEKETRIISTDKAVVAESLVCVFCRTSFVQKIRYQRHVSTCRWRPAIVNALMEREVDLEMGNSLNKHRHFNTFGDVGEELEPPWEDCESSFNGLKQAEEETTQDDAAMQKPPVEAISEVLDSGCSTENPLVPSQNDQKQDNTNRTCTYCGYLFETKNSCKRHEQCSCPLHPGRIRTYEWKKNDNKKNLSPSPSTSPFKLLESSSSPVNMRTGDTDKHQQGLNSVNVHRQCIYCGKVLASMYVCKIHLRTCSKRKRKSKTNLSQDAEETASPKRNQEYSLTSGRLPQLNEKPSTGNTKMNHQKRLDFRKELSKCCMCGKVLASIYHCREHIRRCHMGLEELKTNHNHPIETELSKRQYECLLCNKVYFEVDTLLTHLPTCKRMMKSKPQCLTEQVPTKEPQSHMIQDERGSKKITQHENGRPRCNFCRSTFTDTSGVRRHLVACALNPDADSIRNYLYSQPQNKCLYCKSGFCSQYTRLRHESTCPMRPDIEEAKMKWKAYQRSGHQCRYCKKFYKSKFIHAKHEWMCKTKTDEARTQPDVLITPAEYIDRVNKLEERIERDKDDPAVKAYLCQFCNKLLPSTRGRTKHERFHCGVLGVDPLLPFKCKECNASFQSTKQYEYHIKRACNQSVKKRAVSNRKGMIDKKTVCNLYVCHKCDHVKPKKNEMTHHLKVVHGIVDDESMDSCSATSENIQNGYRCLHCPRVTSDYELSRFHQKYCSID